jgi:hypothetical protein
MTSRGRRPSRLAEPVTGPRFARTRWFAPQGDGVGASRVRCSIHPGALPRSRGAMRPSVAPRLPPGRGLGPLRKEEGDGAPGGAAFLLLHALIAERVAPLGAPSRLSRLVRRPAAQLQVRASWDVALDGCWPAAACPSPASSSQTGLSAGRAGPRSRPGACFARARARAPRPSPTSRRNRFAAPHGAGRYGYNIL